MNNDTVIAVCALLGLVFTVIFGVMTIALTILLKFI